MLLVVVDEDVPVVLGVDEPGEAHGFGKGAVFVVPCGAAGPGSGAADMSRAKQSDVIMMSYSF